MFGYKDMCFCNYSECINFKECFRALNQKILKEAEKAEMPICQFAEQPDCFEQEKNKNV